MRWLRFMYLILRLVLGQLYRMITWIVDVFRDSATVILAILTGVYVILTYSILTQTRRQTIALIESTRPVQRAYINVSISKSDYCAYNIHRYPNVNWDGTLTLMLKNTGQTPAYMLWGNTIVDSLAEEQLNIRDSLLRGHIQVQEPPEDWPGTLGVGEICPFRMVFKNKTANRRGRFYVHVYFLYKDVFRDCHDFYAITTCIVDTARGGVFKFRPRVTTYTLKYEEVVFVDSILNLNTF